MDIGKLVNNTVFYDGFEDEPEVELFIAESPEYNIHIWVGYIRDIYDKPVFDGNEWTGFTRDYQQEVRTYEEKDTEIDIKEYYNDLLKYNDKHFRLEDTKKCYELIRNFLEYAKENGKTVKVNWW